MTRDRTGKISEGEQKTKQKRVEQVEDRGKEKSDWKKKELKETIQREGERR